MEILRVPSSTFAYDITGLAPGTYTYTLKDLADHSVITDEFLVQSTTDVTSIPIPSNVDGEYDLSVAGVEETISVVRPYVDPYTKGLTPSEVSDYLKHEELARAVIDSILNDGFYFKKKVVEITGLGTDYLPLWVDAKEIVAVYENNVLVTDREFEITEDRTAIVQKYVGELNRKEGSAITLPASPTDGDAFYYKYETFSNTSDYKLVLKVGYKNVPKDIMRATELLVDDIACGKLDYFTRFVTAYNTDQFRIQFDKAVFEGTGNILVDKILSKYRKSIRRLGVL